MLAVPGPPTRPGRGCQSARPAGLRGEPRGEAEAVARLLLQVEDGDPVPDGADEGAAIAGEAEVPAAVHGAQQAGELRGEEEEGKKKPGVRTVKGAGEERGRQGPPSHAGGCRRALTRYANFMAAAPREEPAESRQALRCRACARSGGGGSFLPEEGRGGRSHCRRAGGEARCRSRCPPPRSGVRR